MPEKIKQVILDSTGFKNEKTGQPIKQSVITELFKVGLYELQEYKVPKNLVKVNYGAFMFFGNRLGMNEEILNFILELEKKCDEGALLSLFSTRAFTQSDWKFYIENVVNNPSLKFRRYMFYFNNCKDITLTLNTDRDIEITDWETGNITLKGKMGEVRYCGNTDKLKVEGKFKDIVDCDGNSISHTVVDYDNLPDLYESLSDRLLRLTS